MWSLCLSSTPAWILGPLTCPKGSLTCWLGVCCKHAAFTHIPHALHIHKLPWAYQHGPSARMDPGPDPRTPYSLSNPGRGLQSHPRHTRTGEDTDSPPAANTGPMGSHLWSHSNGTELLARLTHAVPPTAGFGNRHHSQPSGWEFKAPIGSSR